LYSHFVGYTLAGRYLSGEDMSTASSDGRRRRKDKAAARGEETYPMVRAEALYEHFLEHLNNKKKPQETKSINNSHVVGLRG